MSSEIRTLLRDPESSNAQRSVFTIPKGLKIKASKIRLCNFSLTNNEGTQIYFNHMGVYSLLSKISILSLAGTEIDRLTGDGINMMAIKLLHLENACQYSINRQLSQTMCNSLYVNNLGQADLTEQSQRDDASMGMQIYIDVSMMLEYLQRRSVIDEGMTIVFEWQTSDVLGFSYSFNSVPTLAVDEYLTDVPLDTADVITYLSVIQDRLDIAAGQTSFEKRLNSFYQQFLASVYFMNVENRTDNKLMNAVSPKGEILEITIDGRKVIPLKGINTPAKKLAFLQDFSNGTVCIPGYDSQFEILDATWKGLYNPNLGIYYGNKFSYGCFLLNRYINMDFTISYSYNNPSDKTTTLLILGQVLRSYDRVNDKVSFVSSSLVPS